MKDWKLLRFLLVVSAVQWASAKPRMQTLARLDNFGACPNNDKLPVYYNDSGVQQSGKVAKGYGTMIVTRNIKILEKATATINRCKDAVDQNCELFQTWRFTSNVCSLLTMKNVIWTPLFTYTPELLCPIKKNVYKIVNATVDTSKLALIKFPTDGYWRVSVEAFDNELVYCMMFAGKFTRVRV